MAKGRKSFKKEYKWNTKDLYKNDQDCEKDLKVIEKQIKDYEKYRGKILNSADNLLNLLELDTEISKKLERAYIYAHINNDADTLDTSYQELFGKTKNIYTKYLEVSSYIIPELLQSDYEIVDNFIKENSKLKEYERNLKDIFRNKEHILNSEVEACLSSFAKLMDAPDEIMGALTDSDFKFDSIMVDGKETELTESNYSVYLRYKDRNVRKAAFESLYKTYGNFKTTLATILRNEVDKNIVKAKLRKFNSSLEASLFGNEIDKKVYTNLIESVHKNLKSLYKYWNLKKKLLNLEDLHIYDTYADVSELDNSKYSFEEARELILKAVEPLGETYQKDITKSFTDGWIDSCNNTGKRGGAYCTACYSVHPYVLMSYEGLLNDVSTLAHELGHAMHYYYACKYQKFQDYGYSIFVAEVASQVNEILLCRYLLDNSNSKSEKIKIIDDLLQKFKSTIFRQTMFAEFELYIHEFVESGGVLTSQNMCDKYYDLNKLYFGDNVIVDDEVKYEWERIPHFYMNFYVYQYATGFAAAVKIANEIYEGNNDTRDKYLEFLKLGCTKNPIESLKVAGVDMMSGEVLDDAMIFMDELTHEYEALQGSEINE
ncbi:MAG: oligoendopeptidase F [Firmicutes bacterium]|nr:oligoendopeptidase F [Bacillota bacterium]